jgi:general secretion pathway protein J
MPMPTTTRQSGFTLIELLAAIAVLGLLIVGLSRGVQTGIALRQKQAEQIRASADLDAAMRVLRKILTKIPVMPNVERSGAMVERPSFQGEPDRVSFIGNLPTGLGQSRCADITLFLRGESLILAWSPHLHRQLFGQKQPASETELVHDVARLDLAYWGTSYPGQPAGWQTHWEDAAAPELIRLRLILRDRRQWPDLILDSRL